MKKPAAIAKLILVEGLGIVLAVIGAFLLISVLFPIINPGLFKYEHGADATPPTAFFIIGSLFATMIMILGYIMTRWGRRIRAAQDAQVSSLPHTPDGTLECSNSQSIRWMEVVSFVFALVGAIFILGPFLSDRLIFMVGESIFFSLNGILGFILVVGALGFSEVATIHRRRQPENSPLRRTSWKGLYKGVLAFLILIALIS